MKSKKISKSKSETKLQRIDNSQVERDSIASLTPVSLPSIVETARQSAHEDSAVI